MREDGVTNGSCRQKRENQRGDVEVLPARSPVVTRPRVRAGGRASGERRGGSVPCRVARRRCVVGNLKRGDGRALARLAQCAGQFARRLKTALGILLQEPVDDRCKRRAHSSSAHVDRRNGIADVLERDGDRRFAGIGQIPVSI